MNTIQSLDTYLAIAIGALLVLALAVAWYQADQEDIRFEDRQVYRNKKKDQD